MTAGGDLGLTKNSSALCIGHTNGSRTSVAELIEDKPAEGETLKPSVIAKKYVEKVTNHGGSYIMADQHYREVLVEHATPVGLGVLNAPASPAEAFLAVRARMRDGRYRIPNHPKFLRQMREVMSRTGSGGNVTIVLPKWKTGEHGDLVAAFVLMAYQTIGVEVEEKPETGTPEWHKAREQAMLDADLAREDRQRRIAEDWNDGGVSDSDWMKDYGFG